MALSLEELQNQLAEQVEFLGVEEARYNRALEYYNRFRLLLQKCESESIFYSCKNNLGYSKNDLFTLTNQWYAQYKYHASVIKVIQKKINYLQTEIGENVDLTFELTELEVVLSGNQEIIENQQRDVSISMFKTYAVPILVVALVGFGVFMLRQRNK